MTLPKQDKQFFLSKVVEFLICKDPMLEMLQWLLSVLMEAEASLKVGAEKNQHNKERQTYFSGFRPRRYDTRLGTMYLLIPKLRNGGYIPFFLQEKKRSETALISLIQEAYINGVSTRKIERLAKALGIEGLSAGQVSELTKGLSLEVDVWRSRPLEAVYPVLWVDALYDKIRHDGRIISAAILIIQGLTKAGKREILAIEPMIEESEATWKDLFDKLKERGLKTVWLVVSDAHKGIQAAVKKSLLGSQWQRCKVHFMRNILIYVPHHAKKLFAEKIKQIWLQPDFDSAMRLAQMVIDEYQRRFPDAIRTLTAGLEESLQFYHFPEFDKRKISTTNTIERLNKEIRRRTSVVGVFPSRDSYIRLVTTYVLEYSEDWITGKAYFSPESIRAMEPVFKERMKKLAA